MRRKTAIRQALARPEVDLLLRQLAASLARVLETAQGLAARDEPDVREVSDTPVGTLQRCTVALTEPLTNTPLRLDVYLLLKVDGCLQLWHELWGCRSPRSTESFVPELIKRQVRLSRVVHTAKQLTPWQLRQLRDDTEQPHAGLRVMGLRAGGTPVLDVLSPTLQALMP